MGVGEIIYIELYQRSAPVMHNVNESCQSVLDSVLEKLEGKLAAFLNPPDDEVTFYAERCDINDFRFDETSARNLCVTYGWH